MHQDQEYSRVKKNQQSDYPPQKHKRRHPILKSIFLLLFIAFIYIGFQFYQGVKNAPESSTEAFNGTSPASGTNILLIGSDARPEETTPSRSDTIMVLHLGKGRQPLKLVSIMRDTYVNIPGVGWNKINAAHAYGGAELLRQTLKENFDLDIDYYAKVNFQTFEEGIGALFPKGTSIDVEKEIALDDTLIKKGPQVLNAHQLLNYARFRMDEEGDFGRIRRQQQVIAALIAEGKKPTNLLHLPKAAGAIYGHTQTNLPLSKAFYLGLSTLVKGNLELERLSIPIDNSWSYGNYPDAGSVLEINMDQNKEALRNFFS